MPKCAVSSATCRPATPIGWLQITALGYLLTDPTLTLSLAEEARELWRPASACSQMKFVSRHSWGAKEPIPDASAIKLFSQTPERVIVHQAWDGRTCADLNSCSVRLQAIQAYHQHTKNWPDISYNFLISGDGTIYEGIGFEHSGFHTLNYNHDSLGIALIGTFQDIYPSTKMEFALATLINCAVESGSLTAEYLLHGHRDARCTICPGDAAYSRISSMPRFQAGPLDRYSCPTNNLANLKWGPRMQAASLSAGSEPNQVIAITNGAHEEQSEPEPARVVNINSHNKLVSLALDAKQPSQGSLEETYVSLIRRRQGPSSSSASKALGGDSVQDRRAHSMKLEQSEAIKGRVGSAQGSLVLINPDQLANSNSAQAQPVLYVITKTKARPAILLNPSSSANGVAGNGDSGTRGGANQDSRGSEGSTGDRGESGGQTGSSRGSDGGNQEMNDNLRGSGGQSDSNGGRRGGPVDESSSISSGYNGATARPTGDSGSGGLSLLDRILELTIFNNVTLF